MPKMTDRPSASSARNAPLTRPLKPCCRTLTTAGSPQLAAGGGAGRHRAERLRCRDGPQDLLVVPGLRHRAGRLHLGQVGVVHHPVVLGADGGVAREQVVERVPFELLDHGVRVVRTGPLHRFQVLQGGRVVAGVRERRADPGPLLELVRPGAAALVQVPVPRVGEGGAGERVRAEGVDVGDEHQPHRQLDALVAQLELVVLLHHVDQVAAGLHGAQHVRLRAQARRLEQEGREVVVGERGRVLGDDLAARGLDRRREGLLHVLPEGVVGVDQVPVPATLVGHRGPGAVREHVRVVGVVEGYLLHALPVRSVVAAVTFRYSFFFWLATVATASAADDVGTSRMASALCRSYSSWALELATSGLFWWSAVTTSMFLVIALSPYLAVKSSAAIRTASTEFLPDRSE